MAQISALPVLMHSSGPVPTAPVVFRVLGSQRSTSRAVSRCPRAEQISVAFRRITDMPDPMCVTRAEAFVHAGESSFFR